MATKVGGEDLGTEAGFEWFGAHAGEQGILGDKGGGQQDESTELALVIEHQRSSIHRDHTPGLGPLELASLIEQKLTSHAEVDQEGQMAIEAEYQHLASAIHPIDGESVRRSKGRAPCHQSLGPRGSEVDESPADEDGVELAPDALDLGQLWHGSIVNHSEVGWRTVS